MEDSRGSEEARIGRIIEEELNVFRKTVDDIVNLTIKKIQTRVMGNGDREGNRNSSFKQLKLQFSNQISRTILTGEDIKGKGGVSIKVSLVDASTGDIVKDEPEASATVEIVLFHGENDASKEDDWTAEEFDMYILRDTEGKRPLLSGNTRVKLQKGIAVLKSIKFRHRAHEMKPPEFHLGARVANTVYNGRINEAKTGSFIVENYRKKYRRKCKKPSLKDDVHRLAQIGKDGPIAKRLRDEKITTVEDFLVCHLRDPQRLEAIVRTASKNWKIMLSNAQACSDKRWYCYADFQHMTAVVFNIHGEDLRLYPKNQYNEAEAQALLASARKHWDAVKLFDDDNSLQEHLTGLSNAWGLDLQRLDYPACSPLNPAANDYADDYRVPTDGMEVDPKFILPCRCFSPYPDGTLWGFDDTHWPFHSSGRQSGSHVYEPVVDEYGTEDIAGISGVQDVVHNTHHRPRGWNKLLCIIFWSLRIKKQKRQKKQKVDDRKYI